MVLLCGFSNDKIIITDNKDIILISIKSAAKNGM